jgi:hypothetical protein
VTTRGSRTVGLLGTALLLLLATAGVVGAIYQQGMIRVEVRERGPGGLDLSLRVPAVLVRAAVLLVPARLEEEARAQLSVWGPIAVAACRELEDCPDALLVHVGGGEEEVRVEKRNGAIDLRFASSDEQVRVSVPVRVVGAVLTRLDPGARAL